MKGRRKYPLHIFLAMKLVEPGALLISTWPLCEKAVFGVKWKVAVEIFTSIHRSSGKKWCSPLDYWGLVLLGGIQISSNECCSGGCGKTTPSVIKGF